LIYFNLYNLLHNGLFRLIKIIFESHGDEQVSYLLRNKRGNHIFKRFLQEPCSKRV